jgi:hypothetical protein
MMLTAYRKMEKLPSSRAKHRFDCVASVGDYEPFDKRARRSRSNRFKFYYGKTPDIFNAVTQRKTDMSVTDSTNISGVFTPDLEHPLLAHGDVKDTNDALLFVFSADYLQMELFVACGMKNHQFELWKQLVSGELDREINMLRKQAHQI